MLIANALLEGIGGLVSYLNETSAAEKKKYALTLVDEVYAVEVKRRRLMPEGESEVMDAVWDIAEETIDEALGTMIHHAAEKILDQLLSE